MHSMVELKPGFDGSSIKSRPAGQASVPLLADRLLARAEWKAMRVEVHWRRLALPIGRRLNANRA